MMMTASHTRDVCLIGKGVACCRYLIGDGLGLHCAKRHAAFAAEIERRQAVGSLNAKGDNCAGFPLRSF